MRAKSQLEMLEELHQYILGQLLHAKNGRNMQEDVIEVISYREKLYLWSKKQIEKAKK